MMKNFDIESTKALPEHDRVLQALLAFFSREPGANGCFLSGSTATLKMDQDSDLDIGVLFESAAQREAAWARRWDWQMADWFHRFDADHIKPHFVIYLFEPEIKADINFYIRDDLPKVEGGQHPFSIVWDHQGVLAAWLQDMEAAEPRRPFRDF